MGKKAQEITRFSASELFFLGTKKVEDKMRLRAYLINLLLSTKFIWLKTSPLTAIELIH